MSTDNGLKELCTAQNLIRSNYFSNTYRASMQVAGELADWDIVHISFPLAPLKEKELQTRFGLTKEEAVAYSDGLKRCTNNLIKFTSALKADDVKSVESLATYVIVRNDAGKVSDVYLVSKPKESYAEQKHWMAGETLDVQQVLSLIIRLLQIEKTLDNAGAHFGVIDLDTVYLVSEDDKELVTLGGFLYGNKEGDKYIKLPPAMPAHVPPALKVGKVPSRASDFYSIFSLAWTLLSGEHYTMEPDFSTPPKYAPEQLIPTLQMGINCGKEDSKEAQNLDETARLLNKGLRTVLKSLTTNAIPNTEFVMADPDYEDITPDAPYTPPVSTSAKEASSDVSMPDKPAETPSAPTEEELAEEDTDSAAETISDKEAAHQDAPSEMESEEDSAALEMSEATEEDDTQSRMEEDAERNKAAQSIAGGTTAPEEFIDEDAEEANEESVSGFIDEEIDEAEVIIEQEEVQEEPPEKEKPHLFGKKKPKDEVKEEPAPVPAAEKEDPVAEETTAETQVITNAADGKKDADNKEKPLSRKEKKRLQKEEKAKAAAEKKAARDAERAAKEQEREEAKKQAESEKKDKEAPAPKEEKSVLHKENKEKKEKAPKEKKSIAVPVLVTIIVGMLLFAFCYFYLYPEILKPILMQHYVDEYMKTLTDAGLGISQNGTSLIG